MPAEPPPAPDDGAHALVALAVLERVGEDLSTSLDIDEALRRVVAAVVPALADWCALDLVDGDGPLVAPPGDHPGPVPAEQDGGDTPDVLGEIERRRVRTAVAHRDPDQQHLLWRMSELDARRPGASVVPRAIASGASLLLERLTQELEAARAAGDPELAALFATLDNRAGAVVPLVARGRVIGALTVSMTGLSGRPFGRRELGVVEILAARAALAVDNARLFAAEAAERRRAATLAEAGITLSGSLRRQDVLDVLLGLVVPDVADLAFVLTPVAEPADALRPAAARHGDPAAQDRLDTLLAGLDVRRGRPGPGTAWASGRTQVHRNIDAAFTESVLAGRPDATYAVRALGTRSSVHVPLVAGGTFLGVLSLNRLTGTAFSDGEARFLTELGRRAALALANADAYERQRDLAADLQRALLPRALPVLPGLQVAGRYLAGGSGTLVGGDWYDVVPLPDGRLGLCVGDVMGRGATAAALMGQLRAALRAYATEGYPPREVLGRLAGFMAALDEDRFATCLYAVHDPAAGMTVVASAGHPPPLLVRPTGGPGGSPAEDVAVVEVVPGPPLGVGHPAAYSDTTVRLGAGDCLLLFTDGLVEDRDVAVVDGLERLAGGLSGSRPATADAACAAALRVMGRDGAHDDDIAVLAVRVSAPRAAGTGPDDDGPDSVHVRLSARPQSAAAARRHVAGALARWGYEDCLETATLLVSELVANAVRHGHGPIDLTLHVGTDGLVVRIGDASPVEPVAGQRVPAQGGPSEDVDDLLDLAESGRGLLLVEALADAWGWAPRADSGKDVWFRLARPDRADAHPAGAVR
ncbi:SpoIIE family protein phosphatase [Kineosporia sp. A_224]|uniref:SpoIIE family protein phosphatase n=1 Tax=Kineosporia sp. A_224 TaxID=1962180 RepID=UPI00130448FE|nr:SpoIIE family protein phosphatase [Kineosporia sp. A_224]